MYVDKSFSKNFLNNIKKVIKGSFTFAYENDFVKAFGSVAAGHKWGFDKTTGRMTRTALTSSSNMWIIPDNFGGGNQNAEGWNANYLEGDYTVRDYTQTLNDFDFSNYFTRALNSDPALNVTIFIAGT